MLSLHFFKKIWHNEKNFIAKNTTQKPTDEKLHTQPKAMNQQEAFTKFRMNSLVSLNKTYEFSEFTDPMNRN
jgi:hypothetical protein